MSYDARVFGVFKDTNNLKKNVEFCSYHFWRIKVRVLDIVQGRKQSKICNGNHSRNDILCKIVNLVYAMSIPCTECDERICISIKWVQISECELIDQWSAI